MEGIEVRGRDAELSRVAAALAGACEGRSAVLVLAGAAGIGKTALLEAAVQAAPAEVQLLRAAGVEAERDVPHSVLSSLCRPLRTCVDALPEDARAVLAPVLSGASQQPVPAPQVVGLALLDLLAVAAAERPLVVVVDDHQWVDGPSRQALEVVLRRLRVEPVCVLVAHRTTDPARDLPQLPVLRLGPLDDDGARRMLRDLAPTVAAPVSEAVLATAGGSPFVLSAVVQALSPAQLAGQEPVPDPLPADAGALTDEVLAPLPDDLVLALATAAAEPSCDVAVVRGALALLGLEPALLEQAEQRRLVLAGGGRVAFSSPLLRSAAYHRHDRVTLRQVHRALAACLPPGEVERRAWHLAEAAVERDDAVAEALVEAARAAVARGAPAEAAADYQRAGRLSTQPGARAAALLAAAQQAVAAGHVEQATSLAREVEETTDDVHLRGEARIVLARMTSLTGDPTTAYHAVHELVEVVAPNAPGLAARLCIEAVALAFKAVTTQAVPCGERAVELAGSADDPCLLLRARLALAVARSLLGEPAPEGGLIGMVEQALENGVPVIDIAGLLTEAALGLHATGRGEEGMALVDLVARAARGARAVGILPQVLLARADLENSLNRYGDSWTSTVEAAELVDRLGQHAVRRDLALRLGALQALRGEPEQARRHYAEVLAHGSRDFLWLRARRGLGVLELGEGRPEAAVNSLEQLDVMAQTLGRADLSFGIYEHDLTHAYVELGRLDDARALTERFALLAEPSPLPTGQAALAYMRAVLAPDDDVDGAFGRALELARPQPFLHVRVLTLWAQRLVRLGRAADAAGKVEAAREIAEVIGAPGVARWVVRAAAGVSAAAASPAAPASPVPDTGARRRRADHAPPAPPEPEPPAAPASAEPTTLLRVLGRWELHVDGRVVAAPDGVPGRALRVLALRGQIHVEELTELLWPDSDAASGRMRLRNVVSRIRSSAGPIVERRGELVSLAPQVEVDVDFFAQLARAAHAAAELGDLAAAAETGERALALHIGPLLPDSPYADWALVPRERTQRVYVGLLDLLAHTAARRGDVDGALGLLERAMEAEPFEEERYLRAVELCLDAGRRGAAAALLERADSVAERLGVPPDPRQAELAKRMRRGPAAAAGA